MVAKGFDCAGWVTKADLRCSDGRVIMKDAFRDCNGMKVPLVWNHKHDQPESVLGHCLLESRDGSMYGYCYFNNTETGKVAKELVQSGDVNQFSIYANKLKEEGHNVIHGIIREVSLVLAGANPGAYIDSVIAHNEDGTVVEDREQGWIYIGEENDAEISFEHAEETAEDKAEETIGDVYNTLSDKQKAAVMAIISQLVPSEEAEKEPEMAHSEESSEADEGELSEDQQNVASELLDAVVDGEDDKKEEEAKEESSDETPEEEKEVKHNVFDHEAVDESKVLTHSDGVAILNMAKEYGGGSLKAAMQAYVDSNKPEASADSLMHAAADNIQNISQLFPEYKDVKPGAPELLTTDQGWIGKVLARVHKSPISRIRTRQADVRDISNRRAKPYTKGAQKTDAGSLPILSRTTDPVTVYIRSKIDRDDIIDITDFDVVQYMYNLDRMNLNEELARQITIGDGRSGENAIDPTKIRPIWTDDELYCIHRTVDVSAMRTELTGTNSSANFGENYVYAEAVIQSLLYAREQYKGSGNPVFMCTPHLVNVMLLARDLNGRRIYDNVGELKSALNVAEIITAEQFEGKTRTKAVTVDNVSTNHTMQLLGLLVNFSDYSLGATKGGEITHFTDFDINFNQEVSLLETRCSGALVRPFSAIALEEDVTSNP